jgi:type IV secretory pathway VirD2 relaxase
MGNATAAAICGALHSVVSTLPQVSLRGAAMPRQTLLPRIFRGPNWIAMARNSTDDLHVRLGRTRDRAAGELGRYRPFVQQVEIALRKAGGDPNRIGGAAAKRRGRFNARGRGGKLGVWRPDSAGRARARRVVIKARVVKLNPQRRARGPKMPGKASRAAAAHLRYLERDGVTRDGKKGRAYSALENEADGRAFLACGEDDRHQFRFIVAPEDAADMGDLRGFTRGLMRQMEEDLGTRLDWIAVDHHNTGHPHIHIIVRGVTDDGKILNIAGDYIAHGVRHRASELVTRELGHQSEHELARKLASEVEAERVTRLDRMLIAERGDDGVVDLRPGEGQSYLVRENRHLLIDRAKRLERFGLAREIEPGCWLVASRTEETLKALGERNDIIKTMHRALADHGLAEFRGIDGYAIHGSGGGGEEIIGRVVGKGLAGDEMSERVYLVIDGIDARIHQIEFADPARLDVVRPGMIVEAAPAVSGPRNSDRNIAIVAEDGAGIYRPSRHVGLIRDSFAREGKDPDAFVRFHVRRLEALRRAGHVERIDADHWRVPADIVDRGMAYDASQGADSLRVRILSTLDLEQQIGSDGATWLDRDMVSSDRVPLVKSGFGYEVAWAHDRRCERLVEMGHATRESDGAFILPRNLVARLERQEVERVGQELAKARGTTFNHAKVGEYVSGTLAGSTDLASGRFAMIENGLGFTLVPWQPVLDQRIGQHITGVMRGAGGIEWDLGRKLGLGL